MKLSENDSEKIYQLHLNNVRSEDISEMFNVATGTINRIISTKNKENNINVRHRPPNKAKENLSGQIFGYLVVLEQLPPISKRHNWRYKCKCQICDNEIVVEGRNLKTRKNKSCGCIKFERKKRNENSTFKGHEEISGSFWHIVKRNAKLRNINVNITIEDAWNLFIKQDRKCALSGVEITFGSSNYDETTASLDRIDSLKPYDIDNVQWVHKSINFMKHNLSEEKFLFYCEKVVEYGINKRRV